MAYLSRCGKLISPTVFFQVWLALKKLMTPTALNFFAFVFILGFQWGIRDSYLAVYLQEDLGADSDLISEWRKRSFGTLVKRIDPCCIFS